jgi:hypothetical protein
MPQRRAELRGPGWSRTRASSGPVSAESSTARASSSRSPPTTSSGSPARSPVGIRAPNTRPTDSVPSRRARNARTCAEALSSHCSSSTMHTSGRSPATSDSRPRAASPIRNRSAAGPALRPNAVRSASRCGAGRRSRRSSIGAHSWCSTANASSISDWTPTARTTRQPGACPARYSNSAVLPTPGSPRTTRVRLSPARTAATSRSSTPHSARRPVSSVTVPAPENQRAHAQNRRYTSSRSKRYQFETLS